MPVGTARAVAMSTCPIGSAAVVDAATLVRALGVPTSSTVPQAWHSPQRPTHLAVVHPHSAQRKVAEVLPRVGEWGALLEGLMDR